MKLKFKNFAAVIFIILIIYFMCSALGVFGSTLIDKARGVIVVKPDRPDRFAELYPFEDMPVESYKNFIDIMQDKIHKAITEKINIQKSKIEAYTTDKLIGYMKFTELAKSYEALMNWNVNSISEYNNIVELADGYFSGIAEKRDVNYSAENTIRLANFCAERNIKFLYANAPAKICVSEDANISGKIDFVNQNADEFLKILENNNINYLDFRKILHDENLGHHAAFFRTDHHWLPSASLWAARYILNYLKHEYKYDVKPDILKPENFKVITYPKWFLGSQGKKVTLARAEPDDFDLIYPKFKTSIRYENFMDSTDVSGDFSLMYDMKYFNKVNYYEDNVYASYPLGFAERKTNNLAENNLKILFLHDSFGDTVIPFLTLAVKQLDILDLRVFTGSVKSYIKQHTPDCVIVLYNSDMIGKKYEGTTRNLFDLR